MHTHKAEHRNAKMFMLQMSMETKRLDYAYMLRDQDSEKDVRNKRVHTKFTCPYKLLKLRKPLSKDVVIIRRGGAPK